MIESWSTCERESLVQVCGDFEELLRHMEVDAPSARPAEHAPAGAVRPAARPVRRAPLFTVRSRFGRPARLWLHPLIARVRPRRI